MVKVMVPLKFSLEAVAIPSVLLSVVAPLLVVLLSAVLPFVLLHLLPLFSYVFFLLVEKCFVAVYEAKYNNRAIFAPFHIFRFLDKWY